MYNDVYLYHLCHFQVLQQQVHKSLQEVKQGNFFNKASSSLRFKFSEIFPEDLMQWRPFIPKWGGLIQEEIGGHPPIPLAHNMGFHIGIFLRYSGS
jgi:hypothetical protein